MTAKTAKTAAPSKTMTAAERRVLDLIRSRPGICFVHHCCWRRGNIYDDNAGRGESYTSWSVMDRLARRGLVPSCEDPALPGGVGWDPEPEGA